MIKVITFGFLDAKEQHMHFPLFFSLVALHLSSEFKPLMFQFKIFQLLELLLLLLFTLLLVSSIKEFLVYEKKIPSRFPDQR